MAFTFTLNKESLKRRFSVYVVVASGPRDIKLYVGKTGDNNDGCNPLISRCGNHFSYNKMHSQIRNKLDDHEGRDYTCVFDHFDVYPENETDRRACIDKINEMERWLNQRNQTLIEGKPGVTFLNPFSAVGHVSKAQRAQRAAYRTDANERKIASMIASVAKHIESLPQESKKQLS